MISVSVVSHGQIGLVGTLLDDLATHCSTEIEVLITINRDEEVGIDQSAYPFRVSVTHNEMPKGFGANHNAASHRALGEYFCVVNPDIRICSDPFPALMGAVVWQDIGVAGPRVMSPHGSVEDSGRVFPTPTGLLKKLWRRVVLRAEPEPDYPIGDAPIFPDWIGGMCMLFTTTTFRRFRGFDERYFLYYEDVDLCWRMRRAGLRVALVPSAEIEHGAQRSSWRRPRYLRWHLASMARFLVTQARR